jgi:hypothetical protein
MLALGQPGDEHVERVSTYFRHSSYRNYVLTWHAEKRAAKTRPLHRRSEPFALQPRYE